MFILIEGASSTGKTILAHQLSGDLELPYFHLEQPVSLNSLVTVQMSSEMMFNSDRMILDQFHLTAMAHLNSLDLPWEHFVHFSQIDDYIARHNGWLVLLQDDPFAICQRISERIERDRIGEIQNRFNMLFDSSSIANKGRFTLRQFFDESNNPTDLYQRLLIRLRNTIGREDLSGGSSESCPSVLEAPPSS